MLCFRCEHRAEFLESGRRPRCECGDVTSSKSGCYMFAPCKPIVLTRADGYKDRPVGLPTMIAPRMHAVGEASDMSLALRRLPGDKYVFVWTTEKEADVRDKNEE